MIYSTHCRYCRGQLNNVERLMGDVCRQCTKKDFLHRNPLSEYFRDIDVGDIATVYPRHSQRKLVSGMVTKETPNFLTINNYRVNKNKFKIKKRFLTWW